LDYINPLLATLAAYLIGSLSFAVLVSRLMGLKDPRTYGSKNPGATNVLRSGSKAAAIVTLLLDAFKGWLPVVVVKWLGDAWGLGDGTVALVGIAAFLGHLFPAIIAYFFRYSSLASIVTAVFAPAFFLFGQHVIWEAPGVQVLSLAAMGVLLVWRHAENINRLIAGKESKLGAKK
jgi:acyl phosphate:glycerol-3-phosphate acyltransferase